MHNEIGGKFNSESDELDEVLSIILSCNGDNIDNICDSLLISSGSSNSRETIIDMYIQQRTIPLALRKRLMYQRTVNS